MKFSCAYVIFALAVLAMCQIATGYSLHNIVSRALATKRATSLNAGSDSPPLNEKTRERIDKLVKDNKVLLFMKGNKLFPQW